MSLSVQRFLGMSQLFGYEPILSVGVDGDGDALRRQCGWAVALNTTGRAVAVVRLSCVEFIYFASSQAISSSSQPRQIGKVPCPPAPE